MDQLSAKLDHQLRVVEVTANGQAKVAAIQEAGEVAVIGQRHLCNANVSFTHTTEDGELVSTQVVAQTLANNSHGSDGEHGACKKNTDNALKFILSH